MVTSTSTRRKLWSGIIASLLLAMAAIAIGSSAVQAGLPTGTFDQPSASAPADPNTKISPALRSQFAQAAGSKVRYIVALAEKANIENDIGEWNAKGRYVLDALREVANRTQPPVAAALDNQKRLGNVDSYKSYYIINALRVKGNLASAEAIATLPQVALIEVFPIATLDEPVASSQVPEAPLVTEWNVDMVRAPQAWALDCNGSPCNGTGVIVGNLDTGARYTHQALVGKYRGNLGGGNFNHNYNWWDPATGSPFPIDGNGHGTHTTGTIVGDDGGGNQVGVAPGARWIASSGIADGVTDADIIEAGQFMLAPWDLNMQNPDPSKRPVVVSNSWGFGVNAPACPTDTFFRDVVLAWRAAGIFPSFSAGNGFPQGNRVPAAYPETFETGALNRQNIKASYSSQGPSCFDQGQHPQIMAGGGEVSAFNSDLVRSASNLADNQYAFLSGTSMAQPATAGAVAILKQANPSLTITQTWNILTTTAFFDPSWGVRPNPLYGYGRLQIDQAVLAARALQGTPTPTVTGTPPTPTPTSSATNTPTLMPTNTVAPMTPSATPACVIEQQSSNVPLPIIDMITISSTLTIANGPVISSVEVTNIGIEHGFASDLDVFLVSPSGTRVELFTDICGDGDFTAANTGFTLADRGGILIGEVCPPNQGTYKPEGSLATLVGQPSSGTWFLEITDDELLITGNLLSWGLRISSNSPCTTGTVVATATSTGVAATSTSLPPTQTPGGPTATLVPTETSTSITTATNTITPVQPTSTSTMTAVVPTQTPGGPTSTLVPTGTNTAVLPTSTATAEASMTATQTATSTSTITSTQTPLPPTNTATATASPTCAPSTAWVIVPGQDIGTEENRLQGVAAVSSNYVWAVGFYKNGGVYKPLIERWDGSSWAVVPSPAFGLSNNVLLSVTAISANDAWAVGYFYNLGTQRNETLTMHWNGTQWAVVPSPNNQSGIGTYLFGVSASASNDVWAVGWWDDGETNQLYAIHWNGTQWSQASLPNVGPVYNVLAGVTAISANDVWAVGSHYAGTSFNTETLTLHWNGTSWSMVEDATPANSYTRFEAVDASSPNDVWAVGWGSINNQAVSLIQHWNGTSWSIVNSPSPGTVNNYLQGVSATAPNDAWAVGAYDSGNGRQTLTMHWDGTQWLQVASPHPTGPKSQGIAPAGSQQDSSKLAPMLNIGPGFAGVAALSGNDAWAVGSYGPSATSRTLIERYYNPNPCPVTPTPTSVATNTPTRTATATATATATLTVMPSATRTSTATQVPPTATATGTATPTQTSTSVVPSSTPTSTSTSVPSATPTVCTISFTDVPPDSTFYIWIRCLACRGIISGYSDGTFRPGNEITRGQIAKMVSNAAGFNEDPGPQIYEDVDPSHTFYVWINRLSMRGHMGGYPCDLVPEEPCVAPDNRPYFRPFANATRGQLAKIVANAAGVGGTPTGLYYTDVPEDNPFYTWIMRLTNLGVMGGYPCGGEGEPCDDANRPYFRPFANVTRGQASKIVANTFYPNCHTPSSR